MKTTQQLAKETDPLAVRARAAIRRLVVKLTAGAIWQVTGFRLLDGGTETRKAEAFTGIGLSSRPPGDAEAIVVMVGDGNTPIVIAVRDEATRKKVASAIGLDETMLFNSTSCVYLKADGAIEARSSAGVAVPLATKHDIDALATWIHTIMIVNATGAFAGTTTAPPSAAGTTKLKGE